MLEAATRQHRGRSYQGPREAFCVRRKLGNELTKKATDANMTIVRGGGGIPGETTKIRVCCCSLSDSQNMALYVAVWSNCIHVTLYCYVDTHEMGLEE
ncbi:hypothetical protein J6590_082496 [Homalodisca vitripennis]|nr:hypothetical protein J6590_082496 [Homalodisca vitripennis]